MAGRLTRLYIEEMAKHLPPSASSLRLLDVDGAASGVLSELRADLDVMVVKQGEDAWNLSAESIDAVVAYGGALEQSALEEVLKALRPGGRLIMVDPAGAPDSVQVDTLESAGYTRILVSPGIECPTIAGVMMRGEKPHTTEDTLARVQSVAERDDDISLNDLSAYKGRYVHLLVRQTPNKPVWALKSGEQVEWQAVAVENGSGPMLLAFSSLPRAVAFMQPVVTTGQIKDINKVAKFSRETAKGWTLPVILNPTSDVLDGHVVSLISVDPTTAEAPEE
jgi:hypothetical protein